MSNKTFYIAKDVEDKLIDEPNMGGLINDLLRKHWGLVQKKVEDFATVGIRSTVETKQNDEGMTTTVTPNKSDVKKFRKSIDQLTKELPNTVKASEAVCKGTHFMNRTDCGKKDCPWA